MAESGDLSAQYTLACDYLEGNSRFPDSLNEPENRYYRYSKSHQYFTNLENYIERIKTISNRDSLHFLSKTVRNGKWESAFCIVYFDVINSVMLVVFFSISKFMGCKQSAEYNKKIENGDKVNVWFFIYCIFQALFTITFCVSIYYNNNGGFSAVSSILVCLLGVIWGVLSWDLTKSSLRP